MTQEMQERHRLEGSVQLVRKQYLRIIYAEFLAARRVHRAVSDAKRFHGSGPEANINNQL